MLNELTWQQWVTTLLKDDIALCRSAIEGFLDFEWAAHLQNSAEASRLGLSAPIGSGNLEIAAHFGSPRVFSCIYENTHPGLAQVQRALVQVFRSSVHSDRDSRNRSEILLRFSYQDIARALRTFLETEPPAIRIKSVAYLLCVYADTVEDAAQDEFGLAFVEELSLLEAPVSTGALGEFLPLLAESQLQLVRDGLCHVSSAGLSLILGSVPWDLVQANRDTFIRAAIRLQNASVLGAVAFDSFDRELSSCNLPFDYIKWNVALGLYVRHLAGNRWNVEDSLLYLPYAQQELARASEMLQFKGQDEADLEKSFIAACASVVPQWNTEPDHLCGEFYGVPISLGFVIATVVAASRMESGEYYSRLDDLLQVPFKQVDACRRAWADVAGWVKGEWDLEVPLRAGLVATAIEHCLLRHIDLTNLLGFFVQESIRPGAHLTPDQIEDRFVRWGSNHLTSRGRDDLEEPLKRSLVLRQVCQQIRVWDGSVQGQSDRPRIRSTFAVLGLLPERDRWRIAIAARRASGMPSEWNLAPDICLTGTEESYEPAFVDLAENLDRWLDFGCKWSAPGSEFILSKLPARAFVQSQTLEDPLIGGNAWIEVSQVPLGARCIFLCHNSIVDELTRCWPNIRQTNILSEWLVCGPVTLSASDVTPSAWVGIEANRRPPCAKLDGGLKLSAGVWLLSAPPKVVAEDPRQQLSINGAEAQLDPAGCAVWAPHVPGPYVVSGSEHFSSIKLWLATGEQKLAGVSRTCSDDDRRLYALERGLYTLLASNGASLQVSVKRRTTLVRCPFQIAWLFRHSPPALFAGDGWDIAPDIECLDVLERWHLCLVNSKILKPRNCFGRANKRKLESAWLAFRQAGEEAYTNA